MLNLLPHCAKGSPLQAKPSNLAMYFRFASVQIKQNPFDPLYSIASTNKLKLVIMYFKSFDKQFHIIY